MERHLSLKLVRYPYRNAAHILLASFGQILVCFIQVTHIHIQADVCICRKSWHTQDHLCLPAHCCMHVLIWCTYVQSASVQHWQQHICSMHTAAIDFVRVVSIVFALYGSGFWTDPLLSSPPWKLGGYWCEMVALPWTPDCRYLASELQALLWVYFHLLPINMP